MIGYERADLLSRPMPKRKTDTVIAGIGDLGRRREELVQRLARIERLTGGRRKPSTPTPPRPS